MTPFLALYDPLKAKNSDFYFFENSQFFNIFSKKLKKFEKMQKRPKSAIFALFEIFVIFFVKLKFLQNTARM